MHSVDGLSPETREMVGLRMTGNIIPTRWYGEITKSNGKPDLSAILILAELVWWYRPSERRTADGGPNGYTQKFSSDILQKSPKQLSSKFGLSIKESQRALKRLADSGFISRELRNVDTAGGTLGNVCFIRLHPKRVREITVDPGEDDFYSLDSSVQSSGRKRPNITESTKKKKKTPKSPGRGLEEYFPGKEDQPPPGGPAALDNSSAGGRHWAQEASADSAAKSFLALAGLTHFPGNDRQSLARSFIHGRATGEILDADVAVIADLRNQLDLPKNPLALLKALPDKGTEARSLAKLELIEIEEELGGRGDVDWIPAMLTAAQGYIQSSPNPGTVFGTGLEHPVPQWALLTAYAISDTTDLESWKDRVRAQVLTELATDPAIVAFLQTSGFDLNLLFGLGEEEIGARTAALTTRMTTRRTHLRHLLATEVLPYGPGPVAISTASITSEAPLGGSEGSAETVVAKPPPPAQVPLSATPISNNSPIGADARPSPNTQPSAVNQPD